MKKINLSISGCMGRMGQQIIKSAKSDNDFTITALTESRLINKKINYVSEESELPDPSNPPNHCSFYDRCNKRSDICKNEIPKLKGDENLVRCFNELS